MKMTKEKEEAQAVLIMLNSLLISPNRNLVQRAENLMKEQDLAIEVNGDLQKDYPSLFSSNNEQSTTLGDIVKNNETLNALFNDPNYKYKDGKTNLQYAVEEGNVDKVNQFLTGETKPTRDTIQAARGVFNKGGGLQASSWLPSTSANKMYNMIYDPNIKDAEGNTDLDIAVQGGEKQDVDKVKEMIKGGKLSLYTINTALNNLNPLNNSEEKDKDNIRNEIQNRLVVAIAGGLYKEAQSTKNNKKNNKNPEVATEEPKKGQEGETKQEPSYDGGDDKKKGFFDRAKDSIKNKIQNKKFMGLAGMGGGAMIGLLIGVIAFSAAGPAGIIGVVAFAAIGAAVGSAVGVGTAYASKKIIERSSPDNTPNGKEVDGNQRVHSQEQTKDKTQSQEISELKKEIKVLKQVVENLQNSGVQQVVNNSSVSLIPNNTDKNKEIGMGRGQ
jgi:ankyrin repeat protein